MTEQRYDVIYKGEVVEGADTAQVRDNLARLFKTQGATLEQLFSGRPVVIKRGLDRDTALKYQAAMKKAGAVCRIRDNAPPAAPAGSAPAAEEGGDLRSVTIAPPGTTLVAFQPPETPEFDLSAFSMAEAGVDILDGQDVEPPAPPPPADLQMDPPGIELVEEAPAPPPSPAPARVSIAEVGADLAEQRPHEPAPVPDTSGITMAPVGTDMVDREELAPPPPPPATGALSLADSDDEAPEEPG